MDVFACILLLFIFISSPFLFLSDFSSRTFSHGTRDRCFEIERIPASFHHSFPGIPNSQKRGRTAAPLVDLESRMLNPDRRHHGFHGVKSV